MVDRFLELIGKVHKHPFLHLADRGRGERSYVIQELGNFLLDAERHRGEVNDIIFCLRHCDGGFA